MKLHKPKPRMLLCGGTQSGGTTIVSWCFLQRRDTDGILDMHTDQFQTSFEKVTAPILWVKMTIHAFRLQELSEVYRDLGWHVTPLLVVRDVRSSFSSLIQKPYGHNGNTADEPPLRLRFRRYLQDWQYFRENNLPILRYEDLVQDGSSTLRALCRVLNLHWDESMVLWRKSFESIAYTGETNSTFRLSIANTTLADAIISAKADVAYQNIPIDELDWLEETFSEYNRACNYPSTVDRSRMDSEPVRLPPPSFEGSVKEWWINEYWRLYGENQELRRLIEQIKGERVPSTSA